MRLSTCLGELVPRRESLLCFRPHKPWHFYANSDGWNTQPRRMHVLLAWLICQQNFTKFMGLLELHGKSWKESQCYVITGRRKKAPVWGLSLCMCFLTLCFCSLGEKKEREKEKKTKLNTKECVKSSNANRSGAFGRLLKTQRSKCVQLNCLRSSADKTGQASSTQDSGRASGWMPPSPKEAITHIPARTHSWTGRSGPNSCLLRPNQSLVMGQAPGFTVHVLRRVRHPTVHVAGAQGISINKEEDLGSLLDLGI